MKRKLFLFSLLLSSVAVNARENVGMPGGKGSNPSGGNQIYSNCTNSKAKTELNINNLRTLIFINGDMWWDLVGTATYEIPKGSNKTSLFAGAIWVGGLDNTGNLKVAAQTYRQTGQDFWPGPMDTTNLNIDVTTCNDYDRHWKITKDEVQAFDDYYQSLGSGAAINEALVPEAIRTWPGNGDFTNLSQGRFLAPYFDNNLDNIYDYHDGDYPLFTLSGPQQCGDVLYGDQCIWWIFNDVGNSHSETGSQYQIGLEIQAQAFAFATNDEINNMSFYRYKIINRSNIDTLKQTYFGVWVDPDLGNYNDDFVGCDVARGLGYCYNGDAIDEGISGYGANPPAVGVDFFEGPLADLNDGIDNNRNGVIDEVGEQIIMSKFLYYNNDSDPVNGNPNSANDYYNYLKGIWQNGTPMTYYGNGYDPASTNFCDFMFPGSSDPAGIGTGGNPFPAWDENNTGPGLNPNEPADRRFLQSAGPFSLAPGAVNYITTGAVWGRATSGGPFASVALVQAADDKAQVLFNSCFAIIDGPDAPTLSLRELDKEIIISIENLASSNNYNELYSEKDPYVLNSPESLYTFQGYIIYQLKDQTVSGAREDLSNADKARIVAQCDIKDGIGKVINYYKDAQLGTWNPSVEVDGVDLGLRHSFKITTDLFASGDNKLVNHKTYYYTAVAYGYNEEENNGDPYTFADYPGDPNPPDGLQNLPFLSGRNNKKTYTAIPHNPRPESGGLNLVSFYGDGPEIQRLEGTGNGYNLGLDRQTLEMTAASLNEVIFDTDGDPNRVKQPVYEKARGPVNIQVYDPVKVKPGNFELYTDSVSDSAHWYLKNLNTGVVETSVKSIDAPFDQLFTEYGFFISMNNVPLPGEDVQGGNGLIEGTMTFADPDRRWLTGVSDIDNSPLNWILSGNSQPNSAAQSAGDWSASPGATDPTQVYEKILNGTWAPYALTGNDFDIQVSLDALTHAQANIQMVSSVDIIITSDKSKWSKCMVIEEQPTTANAIGGAKQKFMRKSQSVNLDGSIDPNTTGFSYFPGYAVNVESGQRLNIAFGEDSYLTSNNGADMIWNPTSTVFNGSTLIAGGKHIIYVFTANDSLPGYDGCAYLSNIIGNTTSNTTARKAWKTCMWAGYPLLAYNEQLLNNDVRVRLRVTRPYERDTIDSSSPLGVGLPYYRFSTGNLSSVSGVDSVAKSALDLINIVPNPYYAFSQYEVNQLDNRVKIVNLPAKCSVSIYSPNGTLIRRLNRDVGTNDVAGNTGGSTYPETNLESALDWDLKNAANIPVASGVYIFHIEAPGIGEKTVKWFGVLRPTDLDTF